MKNIKLVQTGQNLTVVVNDVKMSKRFEDKAERDGVVAKVKQYNEKNNDKLSKEIVTIFDKVKEKKKEKVTKVKEEISKVVEAVKTKAESKQVENKVKAYTKEDIERMEKDLADAKKQLGLTQVDTTPTNYGSKRRGEY